MNLRFTEPEGGNAADRESLADGTVLHRIANGISNVTDPRARGEARGS